MAWRDDNRPTFANLGISNENIIEAHVRLNLVQSSYNEETWTHSVPLNIEVDGRNGAVEQSDSYQNVVNNTFRHFIRNFLKSYPNLSTYNKHNFALKDTKNVETSGVKD